MKNVESFKQFCGIISGTRGTILDHVLKHITKNMQNKQRLYGLVSLTRELHFQYAQYTKLSKHARYTMQKIH